MKDYTKERFLTKYALSEGIVAVMSEEEINQYGYVETKGYGPWYKVGRDIFDTRAEAEAQAEKMRLAKIKSLEKQLDKLRRLSFKEAELKVEK